MSKLKDIETGHIDSFRVGLIVSTYNHHISSALQEGAYGHLLKRGINKHDISVIEVPGAIEIPLVAQWLAESKKVDVIITLGSVIRGDTSHYDLVCESVCFGCQRVSLDHNIPVVFGVLTTENEVQCWDRLGGKQGHKGIEAADCAIQMFQLKNQYHPELEP